MSSASHVTPALMFGAMGLAVAYCILRPGKGSPADYWPLVIASGIAAFAVSLAMWRLFSVRGRRIPPLRGAVAGALTGLVAHPVAWYLMALWMYATGARSSLGERTLDPLEALPGSLVFSFWSLLFFGWLTVPTGAIAGWLLARRWRQ